MKKIILLSFLIPVQVYAMEVISYKDPQAFLTAAALENIPFMQLLLDKGIRVDIADEDGMQAMHVAALNGKIKSLEFLLTHGAQVSKKAKKGTPLIYASVAGNAHVVQLLIRAGACLKDVDDDGYTSIYLAARFGHDKVVKALLEAGADYEVADTEGTTPLMAAAHFGHDRVVAQLLSQKIDINKTNKVGMTALMLAADKNHYFCAELLIKAGAKVNVQPRPHLSTALHSAATNGNEQLVLLLLNAGADPNCKNVFDQTPLFYATIARNAKCVQLLLKAGAEVQITDMADSKPIAYLDNDNVANTYRFNSKAEFEFEKKHEYAVSPNDTKSIMKNLLKAGAQPDDIPGAKTKDQAQEMQKQMTCFMCSTVGTNFCGKCKAVRYCSQKCQRAHWPIHKDECKSKP